jgi:hypothetical protein
MYASSSPLTRIALAPWRLRERPMVTLDAPLPAASDPHAARQAEPAVRSTAHDAGAAARATAPRPAGAQPADAFVVQYEETGVDGPVACILGVFSSESSARDALRKLDLARSLVFHASITSWTLDMPQARTRVEIDLPE